MRRSRDWTLAQVAERTGIPISTLSKIEKNATTASKESSASPSRSVADDTMNSSPGLP